MRKMGNLRQFLKTTSNWKVFFYNFYKLEIYPRALSFKILGCGYKLAIFVSFSRLAPNLFGSNRNIAYFSFQWPKVTKVFNRQVRIAN